MNIDLFSFVYLHLSGDSATHPSEPCYGTLAALLRLAGRSPKRCRPCRARRSRSLSPFALSTGTQVPVEPQRSPLPAHRITPTRTVQLPFLGTLCITLAELWYADRDGPQGVFLQPIARLLARKTTQWTARARATTDRRELCRGSLGKRGFIRVDARRLGIGMGCKAVYAANIVIFARKPTPQTARAK